MGVWKPERYMHSALLVWFMIFVGLIIGRVIGIAQYGGDWWLEFGADGLPEAYNPGALWFYEVPSAILTGLALWKTKDQV
jgi:hypothetical protein